MLIQDSLAQTDQSHDSIDKGRSRAATKSPGRIMAEGLWFTIWHAAMALLAAGRWSLFAERIRRERMVLTTLDDAQLKDIGVTRAQADREAARHWTDLPRSR